MALKSVDTSVSSLPSNGSSSTLPSSPVRKDEEDNLNVRTEPGPPPDGGFQACLQAVLTHIVCLNTWGFIVSFGCFQTYYREILPESSSAISWLGSTQVFLLYFVGAFSGRALDVGYFRHTYAAGVLLQLLGVFTASVAKTYWQIFLSLTLCVGVGGGLQFTPAMGLVATYFSRRRVFALAFSMAGASTGGVIYPLVIRELLFRQGVGYGWTVRILGFIMLASSVVCFALFRTRLPPSAHKEFFDFAALKEKTYLLFVTGMFFNFWALYFAFYYVGQFSRTILGFSFQESVLLLILVSVTGIFGRLIPAYLASKYVGPLNFVAPFALISGALYYSWSAVHDRAGIYVFALLYGVASNTVQGLWPSALGSLTTDLSRAGARMGLGFTIVSFACLTGPPLGGALLQDHGTRYLPPQMWGGFSLVLGGLFVLAARLAQTGWKLWVKC